MKPIKKQTWGSLDVFGLLNGLAVWDDQYKNLLYIRQPFETSLEAKNRILKEHDYPSDITKQGLVNAINTQFDLTPYNVTKKSIFELSYNPIPSGSPYIQDISGYYKTSSGTWDNIGPQIWGKDYYTAKENKVGFIVWQRERFANISGYKNFDYSNIVEVFREFEDYTQLKFEYYVETVDSYNNKTLLRYTDMNNQKDENDTRFTYRIEKQNLDISTNAIVYNLNNIPSGLKNMYYDSNGHPTQLLYDLKNYIDNKYNHTWDKVTNNSCIWDVYKNYGSGQIPSFYDACVPENTYRSSIYYTGYIGGIDSLSYSLYQTSIEEISGVANYWYTKIYPGTFYVEGIPFYYFESPNISYLTLSKLTTGDYSGLYYSAIPSTLTRGMYTILAKSGFYNTYYCNYSRDSYLSGVYEDCSYNVGIDGDKIWSDIYQRKAFLTENTGFKTELPMGRYMIDFDTNYIYARLPDGSGYQNTQLIYDTALTPSGTYLCYDLNPLNDQNLNLEKFFIYLSLAPNGIYYNSLRN
jgi:hypothetical protein